MRGRTMLLSGFWCWSSVSVMLDRGKASATEEVGSAGGMGPRAMLLAARGLLRPGCGCCCCCCWVEEETRCPEAG